MNRNRKRVTYQLFGRNGRLGNCLFQAAATIGYAHKFEKEYYLPEFGYEKYFNNFPTSQSNFSAEEVKTIRESDFSYNDLPNHEGHVNLDGYFQSEKYFIHCREAVLNHFEFTDSLKYLAMDFIYPYKLMNKNIVGVHLRFGDYVGNPFYNQLWETDYYKKALLELGNINPRFLIFSDDVDRAKQCCEKLDFGGNRWEFIKGFSDIESLCLMSLCDKVIMANSSFSWWGSYLGNKKTVIAPKEWFGSIANINTKDLYLPDWILI